MADVVVDVEPGIVYVQFVGRSYPLAHGHGVTELSEAARAVEHDAAGLQPGEYISLESVGGYGCVEGEQHIKRLRGGEVELCHAAFYGRHGEEGGHRHLREDNQQIVVAGRVEGA